MEPNSPEQLHNLISDENNSEYNSMFINIENNDLFDSDNELKYSNSIGSNPTSFLAKNFDKNDEILIKNLGKKEIITEFQNEILIEPKKIEYKEKINNFYEEKPPLSFREDDNILKPIDKKVVKKNSFPVNSEKKNENQILNKSNDNFHNEIQESSINEVIQRKISNEIDPPKKNINISKGLPPIKKSTKIEVFNNNKDEEIPEKNEKKQEINYLKNNFLEKNNENNDKNLISKQETPEIQDFPPPYKLSGENIIDNKKTNINLKDNKLIEHSESNIIQSENTSKHDLNNSSYQTNYSNSKNKALNLRLNKTIPNENIQTQKNNNINPDKNKNIDSSNESFIKNSKKNTIDNIESAKIDKFNKNDNSFIVSPRKKNLHNFEEIEFDKHINYEIKLMRNNDKKEIKSEFFDYNENLANFQLNLPDIFGDYNNYNPKIYYNSEEIPYLFRIIGFLTKNLVLVYDEKSQIQMTIRFTNINKETLPNIYNILFSSYCLKQLEKSDNNIKVAKLIDCYFVNYLNLYENNEKLIFFEIFEAYENVLDNFDRTNISLEYLILLFKRLFYDAKKLAEKGCIVDFTETSFALGIEKTSFTKFKFLDENGDRYTGLQMIEKIRETFIKIVKKNYSDLKENYIEIYWKEIEENNNYINDELKLQFKTDYEENKKQNAKFMRKNLKYNESNEIYKDILHDKNEDSILIKYKLAKNFFFQGFFNKSQSLLLFIKKGLDKYFKQSITLLIIIGIIQKENGEIEQSIKSFEDIITLLKKKEKTDSNLFFAINLNLAYLYLKFPANLSQLKKAAKIYMDEIQKGLKNNYSFEILNNILIINRKIGLLENCNNNIQNIEENFGFFSDKKNKSEQKDIALINYATFLLEKEEYKQSFEILLALEEKINEINKENQINLLNNIAIGYEKRGEYNLSKRLLKRANNISNEKDPAILNNTACLNIKINKLSNIPTIFEKMENLLKEKDSNYLEKLDYSYLLINRALYYEKEQDFTSALVDLESGYTIQKKYFDEDSNNLELTHLLLLRISLACNNFSKANDFASKLWEIGKKKNQSKEKKIELKEKIAWIFSDFNQYESACEYFDLIIEEIDFFIKDENEKADKLLNISIIFENAKLFERQAWIIEKELNIRKKVPENQDKIVNCYERIIDCYRKNKKDEKKFVNELEMLKNQENNQNLLKKVGGKLLGNLKVGKKKIGI